jgi:tetratricopeptide (TPR) repeat protein
MFVSPRKPLGQMNIKESCSFSGGKYHKSMGKQRVITTLVCATLFFTQSQFSAQAADPEPSPSATSSETSAPTSNSGNPAPTSTKSAQNVDTELTKSRSLIASKKYKEALTELKKVNKSYPNNADVNNLLGFASRKLGQYKQAGTYYTKALKIKPDHLGALEYQGELFVLTKNITKAKANLAKLKKACGTSCAEYIDLKKSIGTKK